MDSSILDTLKATQGCVFFALDRDFKYISYSKEHFNIMKKIWGKEIFEGSNILDFIKSDEDKEKAKKNFERVLSGETVTIDENYGDSSFFRTMWRDTYSPIYDDKKNIIGILVFVVELTEHIKMENRFNELEVFEKLVNLIQVGITLVDPNKDEKPIIFANDKFCKMTGYKKSEILGKSVRSLEGEETCPKKMKTLRRAVKNKESCSVEFLNYRKDGSKFINFINISPILDKDGEVIYYIAIHMDITNKIELGKLDTLKNIASGLTHEINTALVSLSGNLDMITYDIEDLEDKGLQKDMFSLVDNIKGSSSKITKIVNTFHYLNISSLERNIKSLNIYDLMKESIGFFNTKIKSLDIDVKIDGEPYKDSNRTLEIHAENESIIHLFEILIENAIDAVSEKQKTKKIDIFVSNSSGLEIIIKDNGCGISEKIKEDIFRPLIKGKKYRGVGLSLYIAKTIVEMYKGDISFKSDKKGTEFRVLLNV